MGSIGHGFARATVTKVSLGTGTVSVKIPSLGGSIVYADVPFYGSNPSVNDELIVGYLDGSQSTPIAISISGGSSLPTSAAEGDIEGVTAGLGLSGGGTTGTVSLAFAPSELSSVTVATDDKVVIADTSDSDNPKHVTAQSLANLASASPGGSPNQVQFNSSGSFGADANFTYNGSAVGLGATLTVGANGTGHDVKFFGDTTGKYMEWDQSDDQLDVTGKLDVTGDTTLTGDLNVDSGVLFVDASANSVGINTASPQVALHVSTTGGEAIRIQKSDTDQQGSYIGMYDDDERLGYIGYAANDDLYLENEASAGNTYLSTGGAIRLAIDTNGKVGIGTTTPVAAIDLVASVGDLFTTANWRKAVGINTGNLLYWRTANSTDWGIGATGGHMYFTTSTASDNSAAAEYRMVIKGDTGSVGIGTTAPVGNLTVKSQNREISIIDSGTVNYPEIRAHAASNATSYANINYNAYSHNFLIEGTSKIIIDNNGDIRPTTDSTSDLGTSSYYFATAFIDLIELSNEIQAGNGSSSDPSYTFNSDGNLGMYRVGADKLGFTANGLRLEIQDDQILWHADLPVVTSYSTLRRKNSNNVVGWDGSSIRYKENVTNFVKSDWENIYNLQAVRFNWKKEIDEDQHRSWGFISEDVYAQIPELGVMRVVAGLNDGNPVPDTVNYEQMCVFLVEAVKDLNTRLAALE